MDGLLITGEFMKLVGTTRNTLIHYDNVGLVKPVKTNQRGDRFYHPFQWYTVELIKTFQTAGLSLTEIKAFMDFTAAGEFSEEFHKKVKGFADMKKQLSIGYSELLRSYRYIEKMMYVTEIFERYKIGDKPKFIRASIDGGIKTRQLEKLTYLRSKEYYSEINHMIYENSNEVRDGAFPVVTQLDGESFYNGDVLACAISTFTRDGGDRWISENGGVECVIMRRLGDVNSVITACDEMRDILNEKNYELISNVYVMTNIFTVDEEGNRIGDRLIYAPIRKRKKRGRKFKKSDKQLILDNTFQESEIGKHYLTSGEFIKLSQITRNALNLYEKKGLIVPEYVKENGYKYYGVSQVATLINMKCLKLAGFPLDQIRDVTPMVIMDEKILERRVAMFKRQKAIVYEKLQQNINTQFYLKELIHGLGNLADRLLEGEHLAYHNRRRFFRKFPFLPETIKEGKNFAKDIFMAIERGKTDPELTSFPIGMTINKDCEIESLCTVNAVRLECVKEEDVVRQGYYMLHIMNCGSEEYIDRVTEVKKETEKQGYEVDADIICLFMMVSGIEGKTIKMQSLLLLPIKDVKN